MSIAQVVPLRRLPSHHSLFDYDIPENLDIRVGQVVTVPFLRSSISAVVWGIVDRSTVERRKSIKGIVHPEEIVTAWQRKVAERIQQKSYASLGHIVGGVIPKYTNRKLTPLYKPAVRHPIVLGTPHPNDQTWWYRSRTDVEQWLLRWLTSQPGPALIITPTIDDANKLAKIMPAELRPAVAHSGLGQVDYRQLYENVRQQRISFIIGTAGAALLPFRTQPNIIIDQEEHPSHALSLQQPRFDIRAVLHELGAIQAVTTPAPSLWWWNIASPTIPSPSPNARTLASLQEPTEEFWLTSAATVVLDEAHQNRQRVLLIAPRRNYASTIRCRTCGLSLDCPVCHHPASLQGRPPHPLRCQYCGQSSQLPATCPHCQSTSWQYAGLGPERLAEIVGRRWSRSIIDRGHNDQTTTAAIGTYQAYRFVEPRTLRAIVIAQADALINVPDFSAEERAWQYLARLEAAAPGAQIVAQTFRPEHNFWQRWRRRDEATWYGSELSLRQRLHVPPVADQWIIRLPAGKGSTGEMKKKQTELLSRYPSLEITILPERKGLRHQAERMLISSPHALIGSLLSGSQDFPTPWQVETTVSSWLE